MSSIGKQISKLELNKEYQFNIGSKVTVMFEDKPCRDIQEFI